MKLTIMTSCAKMPTSCWGEYRHVAVVELEEGFEGRPKFIGEHARGVVRIVREYGPQNVGKTRRCAYQQTIIEARQYIDQIDGATYIATDWRES